MPLRRAVPRHLHHRHGRVGPPKDCVELCVIAVLVTIAIDALVLVSQLKGWRLHLYIPSMTVIALPFFAGSYFTLDMCLGGLLLLLWKKIDTMSAEILWRRRWRLDLRRGALHAAIGVAQHVQGATADVANSCPVDKRLRWWTHS